MVQSKTEQRNALHELGYKIFLDRYAQKDMTRSTLAIGDTVIVVVNPKTGQREIGTVTALDLPTVKIDLLDGESVERDIEHVDKPLETDPGQMMDRVAAGIAAIEKNGKLRKQWTQNFRWMLEDWKFVPAGRILTAAGTDQLLTYYNCYVIPSPRDSRGGIIETLRQMTEIMSRGGGVGINVSSLRPHHAYVKGVNGRSSGAVSWGALYSFVTGLIEQGGCLTPETLVFTEDGLLRLDEIVHHSEAGWREHTLSVMTDEGERVSHNTFNNGIVDVLRVNTDMGLAITGTPNHKVKVMTAQGPQWCQLNGLETGDAILVKLNQHKGKFQALKHPEYQHHNQDVVHFPTILDEELAFFLGYFMGDGFMTTRDGDWRLGVAVAHSSYLMDEMPELMRRLFKGVNVRVQQKEDDASVTFLISNRAVKEFLKQNGFDKPTSAEVRVPRLIRKSPREVVGAFLRGLFEADGGLSHYYPGLSSISKHLIDECATLLIGLGCPVKVEPFPDSDNRYGSNPVWRLRVHSFRGLEAWCANIGCDPRSRFAACFDFEPDLSRETTYVLPHAEYWVEPVLEATALPSLDSRAKGMRTRSTDGSLRRKLLRYTRGERNLTLSGYANLSESHSEFARFARPVNDTWFVFVDSVESAGQSQTYDLEVDDNHTYIANGLVTHNSRRGALMLILNDWHPDVFEFISSKRKAGQITNANISVGVSDKLMEAVKVDGDWDLKFPDTSDPAYDEEWDGDLEGWIAKGHDVIKYKTVKAREIWDAIIESAWASAEPGVFFNERYNTMSNSWYFAPIICTNPCVTGDTRIYTNKGLVKARELFDEETDIEATIDGRFGLNNASTPATRVFMTGVKPVFKLQTKEGYFVRATADHRFMTPKGWAELQDLNPGDQVHILNRKGGFGVEGTLELGRVLGWVIGDGTVKKDRVVLSFFGDEKQELAPVFAGYINNLVAPLTVTSRNYSVGVGQIADRDEARVSSARLIAVAEQYGLTEVKHRVPEAVFKGAEDMQRGFLQALFTADGSFQDGHEKGGSIRLAANQIELLEGVQQVLMNFGIASRIYRNRRDAGYRMMPDSNREAKAYWCEAQHELVISKQNMAVFADEIGFLMDYKQQALTDYVSRGKRGPYAEHFTATIEAITEDGEEEVFDITEPITHSMVVNGIVTHQCGEQGLPAFGVCNLGAINLAKFYDEKTGDVAWDDLDKTARYATRFLDNVIDSTPYFFEENKKQQLSERRVGLNNMGLAELMVKLKVRYGSDESVAFIDKLYGFLARAIYETSVELAQEKGAFPQFEAEKFLQSGYMKSMPKDIREKVRKHGIRNVTLTTQAPTGCVAPDTLISTATGLRPIVDLGDPNGQQWQILTQKVHTDEGLRRTSHFYINGYAAVKKVTTHRGFSLTATPNHRVRVIDEQGDYVWRRMDTLQIGDKVVLKKNTLGDGELVRLVPVEQGNRALSDLPTTLTPDFAEMLGLYMGDGYTKARGGMHIVVCKEDADLLQHVQKLLQRIWGEHRQVPVEERQGCWVANLNGYYISRFLEANGLAKPRGNHGEGAEGAFIPSKVLQSGKANVAAFLRGLFEADGSVHRGTITLASTSKTLISQVQIALLGLGIVATVRSLPEQEESYGSRTKYELRILNRREGEKFVAQVGFISERKRTKTADLGTLSDRGDSVAVPALCEEFYVESQGLRNEVRQQIVGLVSNGALTQQFVKQTVAAYPVLEATRLANLVGKDVFLDEVESIEDDECFTYDLSVPENKTYIANGFVSHNTTGTMVNTSTGIEPFFSWVYYRKSRLGLHEEQVPLVKEWFDAHPGETELPDYFVTAMDLSPDEHVKVQGAIQRWVDSSISKTCNVPNDYTVEQVSDLYMYMYELGCKGGTIYRDGSRDEQVLMLKGDERAESEMANKAKAAPVVEAPAEKVEQVATPHRVYPRPKRLSGVTMSRKTPFGTAYITMNSDEHGNPFEVFITVGKAGSDLQADAEGLGRMVSLQLRTTAPQNRMEMVKLIIDQLQGIGGSRSVGLGPQRVISLPDAVAGALVEHYLTQQQPQQLNLPMLNGNGHSHATEVHEAHEEHSNGTFQGIISGADMCPECGTVSLIRIEGCEKCEVCGYSRC